MLCTISGIWRRHKGTEMEHSHSPSCQGVLLLPSCGASPV